MAEVDLKGGDLTNIQVGDTIKGYILDTYNLLVTNFVFYLDQIDETTFKFRGWDNPKA